MQEHVEESKRKKHIYVKLLSKLALVPVWNYEDQGRVQMKTTALGINTIKLKIKII